MSGNNGCYIGDQVTLHSSLKKPEDRTRAVGHVITCLGKLIPGIRSEVLICYLGSFCNFLYSHVEAVTSCHILLYFRKYGLTWTVGFLDNLP